MKKVDMLPFPVPPGHNIALPRCFQSPVKLTGFELSDEVSKRFRVYNISATDTQVIVQATNVSAEEAEFSCTLHLAD